jgi:hypothetical protein
MDANKQISSCVIRDGCALVKFYKYISLTSVDDFYIRKMILNKFAELQSNTQSHIFFLYILSQTAGIMAAMPGVNHNLGHTVRTGFERSK